MCINCPIFIYGGKQMPRDVISYKIKPGASTRRREYRDSIGDIATLYEVKLRGHVYYVPGSMKEKIAEEVEAINNPETGSRRMRQEWARQLENEVKQFTADRETKRLASYLSRMDTMIDAIKAKDLAGYFDTETQSYFNNIVSNIEEMTDAEREEFYNLYGDLFVDLAHYYDFLKRYSYEPGKTFALDEEDRQWLSDHGYSSVDDYKRQMKSNLKYLSEWTGDYLSRRR